MQRTTRFPFPFPICPILSIHPLPLPTGLLSFSPDDNGMRLKKLNSKSTRKKLKKKNCLERCEEEYLEMLESTEPHVVGNKLDKCYESCHISIGL
jgi:hypothetical protein